MYAWLHPGEEETMQKWYVWLENMKKGYEKEKVEEMHQQRVAQMIKSAEGSAGLLHKISKPTAWRGGAQILKEQEEDARLLDRFEAKRKEQAKHWQCNEEVTTPRASLSAQRATPRRNDTPPPLATQTNFMWPFHPLTVKQCDRQQALLGSRRSSIGHGHEYCGACGRYPSHDPSRQRTRKPNFSKSNRTKAEMLPRSIGFGATRTTRMLADRTGHGGSNLNLDSRYLVLPLSSPLCHREQARTTKPE